MSDADFIQPLEPATPNRECTRRIFAIYHRNFFYFGLSVLPVVVFTYLYNMGEANLVRPIFEKRLTEGHYTGSMLVLTGVGKLSTIIFASILYSFVTAGIAGVVENIRRDERKPRFEAALETARVKFGGIVLASALQSLGLVLVLFASFVFMDIAFSIARTHAVWMSFGFITIGLGVLSRFLLVVPIIAMEDVPVLRSFARSQELAAEFTPVLLLITAHAAIAGMIAERIPYWTFNFAAARYILPQWSGWIPFIASFIFVAWTEPILAIGCAEVYFSAKQREQESNAEHAIA